MAYYGHQRPLPPWFPIFFAVLIGVLAGVWYWFG